MIFDTILSKITLFNEDKVSVNIFIYTILRLMCDCAQIEANKDYNMNEYHGIWLLIGSNLSKISKDCSYHQNTVKHS